MASLAFLYTKQKASKTMLNVQSYDLPLADFKCKQKELGPLGLVLTFGLSLNLNPYKSSQLRILLISLCPYAYILHKHICTRF